MPVTACWILALLLAPPTEEPNVDDASSIVIYKFLPEDPDDDIDLRPQSFPFRWGSGPGPQQLVEVRRTFTREMMDQAAGMLATPVSHQTDQW